MVQTAVFSFVPELYETDSAIQKLIAFLECVASLGVMIGPVVGAYVYDAVGFSLTYYITGALILPFAVVNYLTLPMVEDIKETREVARESLNNSIDEVY